MDRDRPMIDRLGVDRSVKVSQFLSTSDDILHFKLFFKLSLGESIVRNSEILFFLSLISLFPLLVLFRFFFVVFFYADIRTDREEENLIWLCG